MRIRFLMVSSLICFTLLLGPMVAANAAVQERAYSNVPKNERVMRATQANWSLDDADLRVRTNVGFPHTAQSLLLITFSTGLALLAIGLSLKVFLGHRR